MRAYIVDSAGDLKGIPSESYELLEWKTPLWGASTFILTINARRLYASDIVVGRYLYLPDEDDLVFLIEQIEQIDEPGRFKDLMRVTGRGLDGFVGQERIVMPPGGQAYDEQTAVPAETAMKHYVDLNAGPGASANREVPTLTIAADGARGPNVTVAARYQFLEDILRQIGLLAGMGWKVTLNPSTPALIFDVIEGVDHTADVFLDISFDTLQSYTELVSVLDSKTHAVIAGQGEGVDRDIVERFTTSEKAGLNRRETFVDARDVEKGNTTLLQQRGDAVLSAVEPSRRYTAAMHQFGSFKYREHFDLGDLVLLRDPDRNLEVEVRVVGVNSRITRSLTVPEREVEIDRPWPTLKDRVQGGSGATPAMVDYPDSKHPVVEAFLLNDDTEYVRIQTDGVHAILVGPKDQTTNVPWRVGPDGKVEWGSGAGARDTNLYRSAANVLKTDDTLDVVSMIRLNTRDAWVPARMEGFTKDNIAASAADLLMSRWTDAGTAVHMTSPIVGRAGRVVGLAWRKSTALSGGQITLGVSISAGTTTVAVTLTSASANSGISLFGSPPAFTAGQSLSVRYTSDASYAPATLDYSVDVLVEYEPLA